MPPSATASPWSRTPESTRLRLEGLQACFVDDDPSHGLAGVRLGESDLEGVFFRVGVGGNPVAALEPPEEAYARGSDLLSVHPARDGWPFRTQLRWSAQRLSGAAGSLITLTVSLQTDLLDTRPEIEIGFTGAHGVTIESSPDGQRRFQWPAPAAGAPRIVAAPYPTDLAEASLSVSPGECRFLLSPPFLEKGVIRRCRVGLLLLDPTSVGAEAGDPVTRGLEEFAGIAVPLTA